jgi:hypothetical protein
MIGLHIHMDAEGLLADIPRDQIIDVAADVSLAILERGTVSGKPVVAIVLPLPDGRKVLAQTSLALFQTAAKAFTARFGDVAAEK